MNDIEELRREVVALREELVKARERIAVLEQRANMPVRDGHPLWWPGPDFVMPSVTASVGT